MEEEHRKVPFECRSCWHVWHEDYDVRHIEDDHGHAGGEVWLRAGLPVSPPSSGEICPKCGCQQAVMFPDGYLVRHPELIPPVGPVVLDATPLLSPVRRPLY
ncbi:hypothetical protein AB0I81_07165 [Nonomuraea sp. NPDC050404]|uniref:hypothetical protein n=1 Tax=Nonomuraea sp. NPDC050404 TaxID=3155783 RepID=UPI003403500E